MTLAFVREYVNRRTEFPTHSLAPELILLLTVFLLQAVQQPWFCNLAEGYHSTVPLAYCCGCSISFYSLLLYFYFCDYLCCFPLFNVWATFNSQVKINFSMISPPVLLELYDQRRFPFPSSFPMVSYL